MTWWLLPRMLVAMGAVGLGAILGYVVGSPVHAPSTGLVTGSVVGVFAVAGFDALRGSRLVSWLQGALAEPAPRDAGVWGEIGYRVERAMRSRDARVAHEERRLAQFLSAIEASPNGVLMLDSDDRIDWCNSVAADHFGLDPHRDRLQPVTNLVRAPSFVAGLQSLQEDTPVSMPDPRGRGTLQVVIRRYDEGKRLILSQDVTERERAEAMRRDFVANVSHEIRTPLTVLSGFIETMNNLPLTEVERRRVLQLMSQQTQRMGQLVDDLLTLAQLEGSPRPPADKWVSLASLFASVEADALALSAGRHTLEVTPIDAAVMLAGATTELRSAIGNLAINAVRYTPAGGHVSLRWRVLPNGAGEVAVIDDGVGIAKEHLPRLSERFYRAEASRSRETGGTGLGLAIAKHVMQRHGGELDIASELGKGSTFKLVLPAARVRGAAATPAVNSPA